MFFLVKLWRPEWMLWDGPASRWAALAALAAGVTAMVMALARLGGALRIGLPEEETELKTGGIYSRSRNPVYLGLFTVCIASCLYAPHWLNFLFAAIAALVHHRIVLAEERFLEARFGDRWRNYRSRVRRYL